MRSIYKHFISVGLTAATMLAGCSRATVAPMAHSDQFPAAVGEVKVDQEKNGNSAVKVEVKHLAPTTELKNDTQTYVVWAQDPNGGSPANLGALRVNENREGTLQATTPLKQFDLFITAEPQATVTAPTGVRALWVNVVQD